MKEGWTHTTFGEFIDCNPKISIKKGEIVENCEMEDINVGYKFLYPREGKLYNGSNSKFQTGDTVFARITPCLENGKIAQIKGLKTKAAIGSTEFFVFRGKAEISDNEFVYYLSQSNLVKDTAVNSMTGASGRQRAELKALKRLEIIIPKDVTHQKRIASILSAYDDLIEVNNKRIELLEQSARELYKEWFVRMRFPNYQNTKFKKGIPEGWEIEKIENTFDILGGGTPATDNYSYWDGNINWFSPTDLTSKGSVFLEESSKKITKLGLQKSSAKLFAPYSLMMTSRATIGVVGINTQYSSTNQGFITCIPNDKVPLFFLYYYLIYNKEYIEMMATGSTFLEITKGTFKKMSILIPVQNLVCDFSIKVSPLFDQIENLQKQNQELTEIRNRLLPRLISGKLEVKV